MKFIINIFKTHGAMAFIALSLFSASCNKELPSAVPIVTVLPAGNTIADLINTDTIYSYLKLAVTRVGLLSALGERSSTFTVFAPTNAAFRLSGIPDTNVIRALPLTSLTPLIQYHVIGGQALGTSTFPATPPENIQEPTSLVLSAPFLRMSIFPSKRGTSFWANTIPITSADIVLANGIVHQTLAVLQPPSLVLAQILYADPNLTYFTAAVARADSGQTGLNKIDSLIRYPPVNMTVLAPDDVAFRSFLDTNLRRGLISQGVPPATAQVVATVKASSPNVFKDSTLFPVLTASVVKGILAYHVLASAPAGTYTPFRAFSVNFPTTAGPVKTLVNSLLPTHPGILAKATFTGPFVSNLTFTGVGTLGATTLVPFSGPAATATVLDRHAINGTTFTIDKVLIPQ